MHFAEFGVVMMLFLIGLEIEPEKLWRSRSAILGMGGLQVALTTILAGTLAYIIEMDWRSALVLGMIISLSSTAIVMQTLTEKGLMRTRRRAECVFCFVVPGCGSNSDACILSAVICKHRRYKPKSLCWHHASFRGFPHGRIR